MSGIHHATRITPGHGDMLQGWGTLVAVLIGLHLLALLAWVILVIVNPAAKDAKPSDKQD